MAQGVQIPPEGSGNGDVGDAVLAAISDSLLRRGYLTTEWWTTILGGALSAVLALVHVGGTTATHVAAVVAPAVLAALYAISRTMHKSQLATTLRDVFPQAVGAGGPATPAAAPAAGQPAIPVAADGSGAPAAEETTQAGEPGPAAVAQTDPDFSFQGIPPIDDSPAAAASPGDATAAGEPTVAVAQTDPDFTFQGIPPIEDDNG